jgi:ribosomal-protein-alanine N-acetyltransferase
VTIDRLASSDHLRQALSMSTWWPATLQAGEVTLRPLRYRDARAWRAVRRRNAAWLQPWDATVPPGGSERPASFRSLVGRMQRHARQGLAMPFAVEVEGRFAGQVTVNNIVRGSAQFASVGYWLDRDVAGRGVMPTAVALTIDHCFRSAGLHRIEIAIRPENSNSLRVVEKLGIGEVGYAPRYLHIDGAWRDHRIYAITVEECPEGMLARLRPLPHQSQE